MRPLGMGLAPERVSQLSLPGAARCHEVHVEGPYAVIPTNEVTNIPITRPPCLQAGGRRETAGRGHHRSGPDRNGIEDGRAIGENGVAG